MKIEIVQPTDDHIEVTTNIYTVTEGVYYVEVEFEERMSFDASGDSSKDDRQSLYFTNVTNYNDNDNDTTYEYIPMLELILPFKAGLIFGDCSKRSFYGTYYEHDAYEKIITEENKFLTQI